MNKKKQRGIEELKSRYGQIFITPWIIGIILFFAIPLIQSVLYSFSNVLLTEKGIKLSFVGLEHYKYVISEDPNYIKMLTSALSSMAYKLPLIIILSLILALLLNQKFKGRIFFRALYFLPVIIATGAVMNLIFSTTTSDMTQASSESVTGGVISVSSIMDFLDLPLEISDYITTAVNSIFDLIWNCGIQIILFISGLQTISSSIYEASHVEGATKWEQFWFITFPLLGRVIMLVVIFTMVDLFTDTRTDLMNNISTRMIAGKYDETSAMLWFYFLIVGVIIGLILLIYNKVLLKKWE